MGELISSVGCENVQIRCEATDVEYILQSYTDAGTDLTPAHTCLQDKCGDGAVTAADVENTSSSSTGATNDFHFSSILVVVAACIVLGFALNIFRLKLTSDIQIDGHKTTYFSTETPPATPT